MKFMTESKRAMANSVDSAADDLRRTAEAASAAFTVVAIVAFTALALATVAIVRAR